MHFSNGISASESLGLVAEWTHALNGNGELSEVLERLRRLVKADAVVMVRISKQDKQKSYIARSSADTGKVWPSQPRSYADKVIGDCLFAAKPGSIWRLTDACSTDLDTADVILQDNHDTLVEAIVSPMEPASGHTDHLELHFERHPAEHDVNLVIMLIATFASSWGKRTPGMISKKLKQKRHISICSIHGTAHVPILDAENPAQLSRCEFRVCSMLKEGMTVNVIADTLSIGPATVRSHLSSIFSKTDVSSQVELLHKLNKTLDNFDCEDRADTKPLDRRLMS